MFTSFIKITCSLINNTFNSPEKDDRDAIELIREQQKKEKFIVRTDLKQTILKGMCDMDQLKMIQIENLNPLIEKFYDLPSKKHNESILVYIPVSFVTNITDTLMTIKLPVKDLENVLSINYDGKIETLNCFDVDNSSMTKFRKGYLVLTNEKELTDLAIIYRNEAKKMQKNVSPIKYTIKTESPNIYNINTNLMLTIPIHDTENANVKTEKRNANEFHKFEHFDFNINYKI